MANRVNEAIEFSPSTINSIRATLGYVGDRLALLTDIFTGDGVMRRNENFQLSARGAEAVAEMLVEMDERLDQASEALSQENAPIGAD